MGTGTTVRVRTPQQVDAARLLCREYLNWLANDHNIRLDFQGVEEELESLPGEYAPPTGEFLLAYSSTGELLGCIAVRRFRDEVCEVKRLFVRPAGRGGGVGHLLAIAIVSEARELGYSRALLDTGGFMAAAQRVYEHAGFKPIPPYYDNPLPDIKYYARDL